MADIKIVLEWKRRRRLSLAIKAIKKIAQTRKQAIKFGANEGYVLRLCRLGLDSRDLETLIPAIAEIPNLVGLDLHLNQLETLPDGLWNLEGLQLLNLAGNKLQTLPDRVGALENLWILALGGNALKVLPDSLGNLKGMGRLYLSGNKLEKLPEWLVELTNLDTLWINHNALRALPEHLGNLENLKELDFSGNKLETLPDSLRNLKQLETLKCSDNKLTNWPNGLCDFEKLMRLDASSNPLGVLPERLGDLKNLRYLHAAEISLETVPDTIGDLEKLRVLDLKGNNLETLPERLGDMQELQELYLERNKLRALPFSFYKLPWHLELNVQHNQQLGTDHIWRLRNRFPRVNEDCPKTTLEILMQQLYGERAGAKIKEMKRLRLGHFTTTEKIKWFRKRDNTRKVLEEFLAKVPFFGSYFELVHKPALASLLKTILPDNDQGQITRKDQKNALQLMAVALGDCSTPVASFLNQTFIGLECDGKKELSALSEVTYGVICSMAIEKAINKAIKFDKDEVEPIERVQALRNSLFLEGAEDHPKNKVPIKGTRPRLPFISNFVDFGYNLIKLEQAEQFAKMCCQVDGNGSFVMEDGKYLLDPKKIRAITEPYFADLGLVTQRERALKGFKNDLEMVLKENSDLYSMLGNEEAKDLIDTLQHQKELRVQLLKVADHEIDETVKAVLDQKKEWALKLMGKYTKGTVECEPDMSQLKVAQQKSISDEKTPDSGDENTPTLSRRTPGRTPSNTYLTLT